jgi:hypothetical protein
MITRDSAVRIAKGYGLDDRGVGVDTFLFSTASRPILGQPSLLSSECRGLFLRWVKRPERETDTVPTSVEVKKTFIHPLARTFSSHSA